MRLEELLWEGTRPRDLVDATDTPSEIAQAREAFHRLEGFLPEDRQTILELKVEGLSSPEIGERLGISERTGRRVI